MSVLVSLLPLKEFFKIQGSCHTPDIGGLTFSVNVSIKLQQAMKTAKKPMSFAKIRSFAWLWTVYSRIIDPHLKRQGKARLILDLDSSEDPAHGRQEGVNYNGHYRKNCYHPLFCFTS